MRVIRKVVTLALLCMASACELTGHRDGLVVITGNAPISEDFHCTLSVGAYGGQRPQEREVQGQFKESFVVHPSRRGHFAVLACGGEVGVVASRRFKYGRDVEMGGEISLVGRAP